MRHSKNRILTFFFTLTILTAYSLQLNATIRYVSKTGNSTPPYTTWETAADSIQKCINISVFGDTIYVANGVYQEQVVMIPGLALIGAGADSCEINTINLVTSQNYRSVQTADSALFTGFHVLVYNNSTWGIGIGVDGKSLVTLNKISFGRYGILNGSDAVVNNNIIENVSQGLRLINSNALIRNNNIFIDPNSQATIIAGIYVNAFDNNYKPIIDSNYIVAFNSHGIYKSFGSRPKIINNEIITNGIGVKLSSSDSAIVNNNSIIVPYGIEAVYGINNISTQYLQLYNNQVSGDYYYGVLYISPYNKVKNNLISNAEGVIEAWGNQNLLYEFNNVWNSNVSYSGFTVDTTNISVDPMVVNDDTTQGELDFHLQKYSPLIDAGDPTILDRDGSRSDIGLYGGPYGWTYTYQDLAPRPPHNLTAQIEEGIVKLTWNKNTEADFSHYRVYRDTTTIVIYDSSKIVGETPDTVFYDNLPPVTRETGFYYVITAFDSQGNQSYPSEEIVVLVTGMSEHPPIGYDGYRLLANYPNPFNPSTVIPYRLKEAGYVKLYVYDVKGELVRVLVNEWQEKGYYEALFNPTAAERQRANSFEVPMGKTYSDIATGVYLYMIHVYNGNRIPVFSDSGKMILLK